MNRSQIATTVDERLRRCVSFIPLAKQRVTLSFPRVIRSFMLRDKKTRQGYVRKHTLKPAGYFFLGPEL